jgi:hypothetical protein
MTKVNGSGYRISIDINDSIEEVKKMLMDEQSRNRKKEAQKNETDIADDIKNKMRSIRSGKKVFASDEAANDLEKMILGPKPNYKEAKNLLDETLKHNTDMSASDKRAVGQILADIKKLENKGSLEEEKAASAAA